MGYVLNLVKLSRSRKEIEVTQTPSSRAISINCRRDRRTQEQQQLQYVQKIDSEKIATQNTDRLTLQGGWSCASSTLTK